MHLAYFPLLRQATILRDYVLLLIARVTLLGVMILIHMRAFERAQEAGFAESLAIPSRQRFEKLAMEISKGWQEGGEFNRLKASFDMNCTIYVFAFSGFYLGT